MNRPLFSNRLGPRGKTTSKQSIRHTRLGLEQLEERRLLTSYNLLVSTYNPTGAINSVYAGSSVLEYSEATNLRVAGGVATGDHNLQSAEGLAVAPDGSYYVSSPGSGPKVNGVYTGQVLHYSSSGVFLNVLGANDASPATIYVPGALAFGPNGNLYVADLGTGAIYQFDTASNTQQYLPADTLWLPLVTTSNGASQFVPAGMTFAADATHDLIVGDYQSGEVVQINVAQYDANGSYTTLIAPDTPSPNSSTGYPIFPIAMLELSDGNLLIADSNPGNDSANHHQILEYNSTTKDLGQFIDLTTPTGTVQYGDAGLLPQPSALMLDADGSLLVGLAPSEAGDGAVLKYNIQGQTPVLTETIASGLGAPTGLALEPVTPSDILFSTYVDTDGSSVLRYNDATQLPVPGGVNYLDHGLTTATGLAVAPDGSYYVSSPGTGPVVNSVHTGQVLHYSNSGVFLNVLGANDASPATLYFPGALAFGPGGDLYVADLDTAAIYEFDTTSSTQQFVGAIQLPSVTTSQGTSQFVPAGFTFAADASHDLIVGDYQSGEVVQINVAQYLASGSYTTLVAPDTPSPNSATGYPIFPIAMLELGNGDLLIADSNPGGDAADHHQILEYDPATQAVTQFVNLTMPQDASGDPAQPVSMMLDADGNLLVGVAPDETDDGAVQRFSIRTDAATGDLTGSLIDTIASGVGDPTALVLAPSQVSDLLVGNLGDGVLRYSSAQQPLSAGDSGPTAASPPATYGVAVAPDGSYYVSSPGTGPVVNGTATGQVLHYSSSGAFLNVLDQGDASGPTLYAPGTLAFGPDGNLYVADLDAGAVYQYNTTLSTDQQYVSALILPSIATAQGSIPFVPVGLTFAANATRDLIVGDYDTGEVAQFNWTQYNASGTYTTLIAAGTPDPNYPDDFIFPIAMQELSNGNLLIADSNPGSDVAGHHQILEYNAAMDVIATVDLTAPPTDSTGDPPQPTSLQLTPDGSLLVGVSPNEYLPDGAVDEVDLATQQSTLTAISDIGAPAGLGLVPPNVMAVSATGWTNAGSPITALTIAVNGSDLQVYQTGTPANVISSQPAASVGEIQISGPDSPVNSLTIDFSGGSPIPADGVFFDGASGAQTNTVNILDSAGSNAYGLNGTQLSLNGVPAVTMTNTQALGLDIGSGSLDLGGGVQAVGSITLVSGSLKDGTLSSGSFAVQSGKVSANLWKPWRRRA